MPALRQPQSYVYGRRVGCTRCNRRWSVTSGTVMADTKLPLTCWFRAMHLMTSTKQGISAIELGRRLGVSYPTAWYLHKRLRHAMTERAERHVLGAAPAHGSARSTVEADDVYLGGERNQGCGTAGKTRVIAASERHPDGRMGSVAMKVVESFTPAQVAVFRDAHIAPGAHVHTDGLHAFTAFSDPAPSAPIRPPSPAASVPTGRADRRSSGSIPRSPISAPRSRPPTRRSRRSTCPTISAPSAGPQTTAETCRA